MRKYRIIVLAALLLVRSPLARADRIDSILGLVNDVPITEQAVERLTIQGEQFLFNQYRDKPQSVLRSNIMALRADGFEQLVERELILREAKEVFKIPEAILDEYVDDDIRHRYSDRVQLTKQLEMEGRSFDSLRKLTRERIIVEEMTRKFVPEPIISPRKIEDFYVEHRNDFKLEDQVKMRWLVLNRHPDDPDNSVRKRAAEILAEVKSGASFEQMARVYSEGSLRTEGGETGWVDLSAENKVLVDALEKMRPGQFSGVVEAPEGYYLILLEDRHPAHFKPLSEVQTQIEKELAKKESQRLRKQWIERLRAKTYTQNF